VQPSAVHHFVGIKDQVIGAAVDRALGRVPELAVESLAELAPAERLPTQLDILFGETLAAPDINQLIDELVADSYHTPATRHALAGMYRTFQSLLDESLSEVYPGADPTALAVVNHGVLALAHASPTLAWLDFDPDHYAKVRRTADLLLSALDGARVSRRCRPRPAAYPRVPVKVDSLSWQEAYVRMTGQPRPPVRHGHLGRGTVAGRAARQIPEVRTGTGAP
jgi:hypothetical protein